MLIALCRLDELAEGQSRGFDPLQQGKDSLFALRSEGVVRVYLNSCPHLDVPLQYRKDRFMSADGSRVVCYAHGAQFLPSSGLCVYGPCLGERLHAVGCVERDGWLMVDNADLL
ncbi:Rieske 2Fe-2S domain-containing protein [Pseudomonas sp. ML96]|uniref:Rieske (2Fe-2S) protein n=1 Tax=Pseudomonas sp. ML96 TaxID=1523503 RepID=UPI0005BC3D8B|nr:Rieske 2Fe-2S domain-containing protein [Pseudomonas sp. ML96]